MNAPIRPRSVTMTLWAVFLLGGWNGGRALAIGLNYRTLAAFQTTPAPPVRLGIALVWAFLFLGMARALWRRRPFARTAIPLFLILYALIELSSLIFFAQSPSARQSWLLNSLFYLALILFSVWGLRRTAVKNYFEERPETRD